MWMVKNMNAKFKKAEYLIYALTSPQREEGHLSLKENQKLEMELIDIITDLQDESEKRDFVNFLFEMAKEDAIITFVLQLFLRYFDVFKKIVAKKKEKLLKYASHEDPMIGYLSISLFLKLLQSELKESSVSIENNEILKKHMQIVMKNKEIFGLT